MLLQRYDKLSPSLCNQEPVQVSALKQGYCMLYIASSIHTRRVWAQ